MHVQNMDPGQLLREYDFRVEAGSARKPNPGTKVEQINSAMQIIMPVAQGLLQAGKPELFNALMADWGRAMDMDVAKYTVPPPPPPPPPEMQNAAPPGSPPPGP
jgi:hypothetical protein